ncbi:hypothetical protein ABH994_003627 [Bradyrhizobium yuanmingense]|uniref:TIR domain-containing protein n=1 Tax=Bradyrhizobium yuanmingense TaxID=108015 RepID=UPI00351820DC
MTHIFISYARDDDRVRPGSTDLKGFVTFLDDSIRYEFTELGPQRPKIWRDTRRIVDGAQFTPDIEDALKQASLLLVVLSPNWMASEWCKRELEIFAKYHGPEGIRERIVVVAKRHVDRERWPSLLQGQTGFRFYARNEDPEDVAPDREFFDRGEPQDARYWDKLKELAAFLVKRSPRPPPPPSYASTGRTIFVAKPASDMRQAYDRVVSELVKRGYTVVPNVTEDIPLESAVDVIDAALSQAETSIHLLGERRGAAPEDQPPMMKLQLARAAFRAENDIDRKFHRVVWAPAVFTPQSHPDRVEREINRHPLDVLIKSDRLLATDKVEGDSLSKFVDFLHQHLIATTPTRPFDHKIFASGNGTHLFLYHSREDSSYALTLAQALQQRQLEAWLPAIDGPETEIKSFNSKQLADCDGVILCWATASEVWVRAQASALRNWSALGRSQQFCYRALVAAPPPGERKRVSKILFPPSEIDVVLDLSDKDLPSAELLDLLVPPSGDCRL